MMLDTFLPNPYLVDAGEEGVKVKRKYHRVGRPGSEGQFSHMLAVYHSSKVKVMLLKNVEVTCPGGCSETSV